jgi:hypothetical protein
MAGFFQQVLKGAAEGFFNDAYLRDFRHASKTFITDGFANAPKFKYLFHVYFDINQSLINSDAFPDPKIPGLLVKNITLPKFSLTVAEMNQYNRKRYVQTKLSYDPVSITFHDDNAGAIKKVWYNYYSYYYNDTITSVQNKAANRVKNTYSDNISNEQNWGYSGEPSSSSQSVAIGIPKPQFFNNIRIYGFNQHNFSCYTLINPIIERFDHDTYDYYQPNGTMENRMTIRYETVTYEEGAINGQAPGEVVTGFGSEQYYDRLLSPISRPGGNRTVMGQGGLVDAGQGILNDLSQVPPNIQGALVKGLNVTKAWKNPAQILTAAKSELVAGAIAVAANPAVGRAAFNFAAEGASRAGAALQSGSNNIKNTFAPSVPNNTTQPPNP